MDISLVKKEGITVNELIEKLIKVRDSDPIGGERKVFLDKDSMNGEYDILEITQLWAFDDSECVYLKYTR